MSKSKSHLSKLARAGDTLFGKRWIEQYAAICHRMDPERGEHLVLLITSRGSGRWVIPKGGAMKGRTASEVAVIEAHEEAGIEGKVSAGPLGRYSTLKRLEDGQSMPCLVEVFAIEVTSIAGTFKERGQRQAVWVPLAEAGRMVEEPEMRGIFIKLDALLRERR